MATDSASSLTSKRRNSCNCDDDNEDRISRLPDEILSHILSFLPTKHAVFTGILSNRWRSIWTWVPNLDFDDSLMFNFESDNFSTNLCFMNFVNRVLNHRRNSLPVQTFSLECHFQYELPHFNSWIQYAVEHGVRELDLTHPETDTIESPDNSLNPSVFSCGNLEVLKLRLNNISVRIPDSICLPSLRVLHLVRLKYDASSSTVGRLIGSCPVLEELVIKRARYDPLENLVINSRSLKSLKLCPSKLRYKVVIYAPNLESLDLSYHEAVGRHFYMNRELRFLVEANIDVVKYNGKYEDTSIHRSNLMELLRVISNVRSLTLYKNTMNYLGRVIHEDANLITIPAFCNLTHWEVKIGRYGWLVLPKLLECLPNLKYSVFHNQKLFESCTKDMLNYKPGCLSKLEMIEIRRFKGCEVEIELVRYILDSAIVLKKMTIYPLEMHPEKKPTLLEELISFSRRSKCCELVFS